MKNFLPIGIFDSGVGGISVLQQIYQLLPNENIVYIADSNYAPYGGKNFEDIKDRAFKIINFLIKNHDIKLLIIACNTVTACCIKEIREKYTIPIIGMEPAVKPAINASKLKRIGILATKGTLKSTKFAALLESYDGEAHFYTQPCIGLVELIEMGNFESIQIKELVYKNLLPLRRYNVDVIVLGCTHFFYIKDIVNNYFSESVIVIETGKAVAVRTKNILYQNNLLNTKQNNSSLIYSNGTSKVQEVIKRIIPMKNYQLSLCKTF